MMNGTTYGTYDEAKEQLFWARQRTQSASVQTGHPNFRSEASDCGFKENANNEAINTSPQRKWEQLSFRKDEDVLAIDQERLNLAQTSQSGVEGPVPDPRAPETQPASEPWASVHIEEDRDLTEEEAEELRARNEAKRKAEDRLLAAKITPRSFRPKDENAPFDFAASALLIRKIGYVNIRAVNAEFLIGQFIAGLKNVHWYATRKPVPGVMNFTEAKTEAGANIGRSLSWINVCYKSYRDVVKKRRLKHEPTDQNSIGRFEEPDIEEKRQALKDASDLKEQDRMIESEELDRKVTEALRLVRAANDRAAKVKRELATKQTFKLSIPKIADDGLVHDLNFIATKLAAHYASLPDANKTFAYAVRTLLRVHATGLGIDLTDDDSPDADDLMRPVISDDRTDTSALPEVDA